MGEEGVGKNDLVQENKETLHDIKDDASTDADAYSVHESVQVDDPYIDLVKTINDEAKQPSAIYDEHIYEQ